MRNDVGQAFETRTCEGEELKSVEEQLAKEAT